MQLAPKSTGGVEYELTPDVQGQYELQLVAVDSCSNEQVTRLVRLNVGCRATAVDLEVRLESDATCAFEATASSYWQGLNDGFESVVFRYGLSLGGIPEDAFLANSVPTPPGKWVKLLDTQDVPVSSAAKSGDLGHDDTASALALPRTPGGGDFTYTLSALNLCTGGQETASVTVTAQCSDYTTGITAVYITGTGNSAE
jgi:hypothetical protein